MGEVPYISQLSDTATRGMDCGSACALMLAKWIDPSITTTADQVSRQIDPAQDGTNAVDLRIALSWLEMTPVAGFSGYPRIQLVHYPLLPVRYDKTYTKDHWIVRLDDTHYHDPLWRGTAGANVVTTKAILDAAEVGSDARYRVGIREVPVDDDQNDGGGISYAATPAREPYDRVFNVVHPSATLDQWVAVARAAYAARQTVGGSLDDACIVVDGLRSRTIHCYYVPVADQPAWRSFVTTYYPSPIPTVIDFPNSPISYPSPTITATPSTITAGASSTVAWDAPVATSATLNGANVATTQTSTMKPAVTTTYTLVAKYPDASTKSAAATVTVTPVTPPPPAGKILHGCHVRTDAAAARDAFSRGCRCIQIMDHFDVARELAAADANAIIMHRKWAGLENYKLTGSQIAALMEPCQGKVWLTLLNEQDQYAYGTAAEIRTRAQVEIDAARILLARGDKVLLGGFSMGTPNWLDASICQAFRETYAAFLNADTTGRVGLNFHLYSPYPGHMQGQVRRVNEPFALTNPADRVYVFNVPARTKNGDAYIITKLSPDSDLSARALSSKALDLGDDRIWYEGRWRFALDPSYGNVKPTIPIFSDEWGLDEGGVGGGPVHGWSQTDWLSWCNSCTAYQNQPVVVNGTSYPSPLRGGTVFQCSAASGWEGYYVPPATFQPIWAAGQG